MKNMIFESHAHYDDNAFEEDRDALLMEMNQQGIETIINVGASLDSTKRSLELAVKYPFIYAAVGVHPSDTDELTKDSFEWLKEQTHKEKVVAIGEIGLDYHYPDPSKEIQKKWFKDQMILARERNLPVIIHSREAAKDTLDIMKETLPEKHQNIGVVHCFSYSKEVAKEMIDMGYYIGIGGVLTFKNAKKIQDALQVIPLERILIETDSPYLAPEPNRGTRNNSLNLKYVIDKIAEIKQVSAEIVMETTRTNAKELFKI